MDNLKQVFEELQVPRFREVEPGDELEEGEALVEVEIRDRPGKSRFFAFFDSNDVGRLLTMERLTLKTYGKVPKVRVPWNPPA